MAAIDPLSAITYGFSFIQQAFSIKSQYDSTKYLERQQMNQSQGNAPQCPKLDETPMQMTDANGQQIWVCVSK